jgi:hypothetical protein
MAGLAIKTIYNKTEKKMVNLYARGSFQANKCKGGSKPSYPIM